MNALRIHRTAYRPQDDAHHPHTPRARQAAASLGATLERPSPHAEQNEPAHVPLQPGRVTLLLGPSGAGKSTILRDLQRAALILGMNVVLDAPQHPSNQRAEHTAAAADDDIDSPQHDPAAHHANDPNPHNDTDTETHDTADHHDAIAPDGARASDRLRPDTHPTDSHTNPPAVPGPAEHPGPERDHVDRRHAATLPADVTARLALDRPAVDLLAHSTDHAMNRLAALGLGELHTFVNRPSQLSTGQLARLRLALACDVLESESDRDRPINADSNALAGATPPVGSLLLLDEFAANLDRHTARSVAAAFAKRLAALDLRLAAGAAAVVVTPNESIAPLLNPAHALRLDAAGRLKAEKPPRAPNAARSEARPRRVSPAVRHDAVGDPFTIAPDDRDAYRTLAPLHYRPGHPATIVKVLSARVHDEPPRRLTRAAHRRGALAAALVVSMPTLNAAWRSLAWGDAFTRTNTTAGAERLNRHLRCISRVIVDPRFRSRGLASALVRAYLDDPLTPCTEALAAMGRACPFFERAGMTPYHLAPTPRDARLLDLFAQLGAERDRLATPRRAWRELLDAADRSFGDAGRATLERELRRWAGDSRNTVKLARAPAETIFLAAAPAVIATPVAYAHASPKRRRAPPADAP